jgi:hypothetical protein
MSNEMLTGDSAGMIRFYVGSQEGPVEVMRLDEHGMTYKGQRIEDAGEAHRAFLEVMDLLKKQAGGRP